MYSVEDELHEDRRRGSKKSVSPNQLVKPSPSIRRKCFAGVCCLSPVNMQLKNVDWVSGTTFIYIYVQRKEETACPRAQQCGYTTKKADGALRTVRDGLLFEVRRPPLVVLLALACGEMTTTKSTSAQQVTAAFRGSTDNHSERCLQESAQTK